VRTEGGTTTIEPAPPAVEALAAMVRQYQVEQFYFDEAALLDAHRYEEWVALFTDDAHYFVPIRRTKGRRELADEFTKPGEMAFFDDDRGFLEGRVKKLMTGRSWSEDPPSRTRRIIANVRVTGDDGDELTVESNFHVYRTRLKSEEDSWIGSRHDTLRRVDDTFQIAKRVVYLEQTVLLSRNLTNFF
jgi:3-phenylpropionate/cinnamic acid dioxygenase small subunit